MLFVDNLKYTLLMLIMFLGLGSLNAQNKIGLFDNHVDIGEVKSTGFASYDEESQTYAIGGSGKNMWFGEDEFHYLWTTMQGDFILRAEVEFLGAGVDPHRKAGWIIKNDLNKETPHVNACLHGDGLTALQYRTTIGGDTEQVVSKDSFPNVIQLERRGNEFIMSTSTFGAPFVVVKTENIAINNQAYVGLYVCSFAIKNNNDHVLTFDGSLMGISHHNEADNNQSTLYYLPVEGHDAPVQVTPNGAGNSYLHSWSPDNKKMLFTGHRKEQYDIYSVDISTGKEVQLTNEKTLDDGAEYSPDGVHIFFNSVRSGRMKLWRMDADGGNQTQLTDDEYNDWFPHVSPDKKWIAFISFPKDINVNDHPFYKHCLLRIMPYGGGTPKIIGYIYGGQGSINVPSWSPDSKFISFISNSKLN